MNNNDILKRLRYTFKLNDAATMHLFAEGGLTTNREQVCSWLKNEDEEDFKPLYDIDLSAFLNGFIIAKRGKKEDITPKPEKSLNNNIIIRKLKIALNLKDEDILEILALTKFLFGKHELSALFRNHTQTQYRVCKDQVLRNFLMGLQLKYHPEK